ncbi:MAG: phosphate ABC transporter substrate-binding protein [Firmicutes bacterium]|nr:phosphate ABC transporter substrate-binding protein [Bacillota bacterium]
MASCGGAGTQDTAGSDVSGTVEMNGSTSMQKLVEAACEVFNEQNPTITASAQFTGSGAGIQAVIDGTADIGNASRALKDEEKAEGLVENIVALDGIAVITNKNVTASDLTNEQLAAIYTGETSDWSAVGGDSGQIVVIGRESGSGTRDAFEEMLDIADNCAYSQELDSTGAVLTTVASTPNAVGYVSLDVLDDSVNVLTINGIEATAENIKAGDYTLQRPFVMATKGEISEQSAAVQKWFEFLDSEDGQAVIANAGLISAK